MVGRGLAVEAGQGMAGRDEARLGEAVLARRGKAGSGLARRGGHGMVIQQQ